MASFLDSIAASLAELDRAGLLRSPRHVSGRQGPTVRLDGREVLCFCSNNYLGLASDPALEAAARAALAADGTGAGASRLISGSMAPHLHAERALAAFVEVPSALLFSTGYAANVGAIQALAGPDDLVLSDELNHASLIDGCRLSRAKIHVFRHADADDARRVLRDHRASARRALLVTDAIFSMDGDRAPLEPLRAICDEHDAGLLVDEAHALGVVGPSGRGACAEAGIEPDVLVGTLGKAFGVAGAFVAAPVATTQLVANRARSYVFSTAPMPALATAATAAIDLVRAADARRATLAAHARRLRSGLRSLGYEVPAGDTPIIPILIGDASTTMQLSASLLTQHLVFIQGIRPPTVPPGTSRLRVTPIATHSEAHIDRVLEAFATFGPSR